MKPVKMSIMRVSAHPESRAMMGRMRIKPPIMPFAILMIVMGAEMLSLYYYMSSVFKILFKIAVLKGQLRDWLPGVAANGWGSGCEIGREFRK
jgi:hypothetical protein